MLKTRVNVTKIVMNVLGWASIIGAPVFVVLNLYLPVAIAASVAVPAGLLLTFGGLLLAKAREAAEAEEKRRFFYLESCTQAYEAARELLANGNNDRATWIAAARALKHAKKLSESISADSHLRVLELKQLQYRGFFALILRSHPAPFFYGVHDESMALDDAAAASSASQVRAGLLSTSVQRELSDGSLFAVWEAAQWPHDYKDPLDEGGFSPKDDTRLLIHAPGASAVS
jgi:hypothetical protein